MPFGLPWSEQFIRQLGEKEFRDGFVADQVRSRIALLIRALRDQRGWSQAELGRRMGKPQNVVSRLEDPDYGKESLQTLLELAAAFDLPLLVDIPEWNDWLDRTQHVTKAELSRIGFDEDLFCKQATANLSALASGKVVVIGQSRGLTAGTAANDLPFRGPQFKYSLASS
jgi:transcriptional regulator with XRE-family HTH domain